MIRSFRYRAKLSPSAVRKADGQLGLLRELYNAALQERRDHWKHRGVSLGFAHQCRELTEVRKIRPEFAEIDRMATEQCLRRLDLAFQGFFRRSRSGGAPGYPRFRGADRFNSVTFRVSGWKLEGKRLTLRGIGTVKLFLHRPVEGKIKNVTLRRDRCGDWFVTFACDEVPVRSLPATGKSVGVDLGITSFLTTSDGEEVPNPHHMRSREAALKRAQHIVSKRKRDGRNRRAAARRVTRHHRAIERARRDFHFKLAHDLTRRYDLIAVEDLNVKGLVGGAFPKEMHDVGWGQFLSILSDKAESAGRTVIAVDPRHTSQDCSGCGARVPKDIEKREHRCPSCGLVLDRDVNAARNILKRAGAPPVASRPASKVAA